MEVQRLYLDANILILLGEGTGDVADLLSELAGMQLPAASPFLCTSELSLAELLVHPHRRNDDVLIQQYDNWLVSAGFMEVGPVDRSVLLYAAVLRASYRALNLPDAIHLSTAIGFRCSHFLSADARLPDEIELVHSRWGLSRDPVRLKIIRPEPDVLRSIIESQQSS